MRPELRSLIDDYQSRVTDACRLLRERLGLVIDHQLSWRKPGLPMKGWLDKTFEVSYRFHGIGCCVEFAEAVVDFDFGPGGRIDGFDAWRLAIFARSVPLHPGFADDKPLDIELLALRDAGELFHIPGSLGSHLFYMTPPAP